MNRKQAKAAYLERELGKAWRRLWAKVAATVVVGAFIVAAIVARSSAPEGGARELSAAYSCNAFRGKGCELIL